MFRDYESGSLRLCGVTRSPEEGWQGKNWIKLSSLAKDPQFQRGSGGVWGGGSIISNEEWGIQLEESQLNVHLRPPGSG